jgi:hypothetical protein
MDVVFLDATLLFAAAYREGAGVRRLWHLKDVQLVTSHYACAEVQVNLLGPPGPASTRRPEREQIEKLARLIDLLRSVRVVADAADRPLPPGVALPEKDRPILLAALEARASHLLTADKAHFGPYFGQRIEGVLILPPGGYLRSRTSPSTSDS